MDFLPQSVSRLIDELGQLPGIGPKSAQRLTFHLLKRNEHRNFGLADAIADLQKGVRRCELCHSLSSDERCSICRNPKRDRSVLCVVETTLDLIALEKTQAYKGLYHVLQGKLSPLDGVGPSDIRLAELFERLSGSQEETEERDDEQKEEAVGEVILALNPDLEGDTTSLYIQKKLSSFDPLAVSRIARGIPSGGHLEYSDDATLIRAMQGRQSML
jgi:recombination protein RecR